MTRLTLNDLFRPWRRFPQILAFYTVVWLVGAAALTFIHVTSQETDMLPQTPSVGTAPVPELIKDTAPEAISKAASAALASNNIPMLYEFASKFPTSQYAQEARERINELLAQEEKTRLADTQRAVGRGPLESAQLADADENIQLVAQLLENKDNKSSSLERFITSKGFENKYSLGFGLFYSNGGKTLFHTENIRKDVQFDPSTIRVLKLTATNFCFSGFSAIIKGNNVTVDESCLGARVGSVFNFIEIQGVSIKAESLGGSPAGAAWVIGLAP